MAGFVQHGTGESPGVRVALGGEAVHFGTGGIGQTKELADFVKAFAGGIVHGGAEDAVLEFGFDMQEQGRAAAADDQGDVGLELGEVGARWWIRR